MRHLQRSRSARSQGSLAGSVPTLTDIALDAMGSDKAPDPEIKGAIHACRQLPVRVHLVGPEDRLRAALHEATGGEESAHRDRSRSGMDHHGREDRDCDPQEAGSSMRIGLRLVKKSKAAGFLTAGNTGAAMALAKMVLGPLPAWIVLRWPTCCRPRPDHPACCSMWAPMSIASRIISSSSP